MQMILVSSRWAGPGAEWWLVVRVVTADCGVGMGGPARDELPAGCFCEDEGGGRGGRDLSDWLVM